MTTQTPKKEARYPCPVCLGVTMTKIRASDDVTLDSCPSCGGMWFDSGEVEQLRSVHPQGASSIVKLHERAFQMKCHSCHAFMVRNADKCPACGWKNVISCRVCARPLKPVKGAGLKLDVCSDCEGVWVDNTELANIWNRTVTAASRGEAQRVESHDSFFLDAFIYSSYGGPTSHTHVGSAADPVEAEAEVSGVSDLPTEGFGDVSSGIGATGEAAGSVVGSAGGAVGSVVEGTVAAAGVVVEGAGPAAGAVVGRRHSGRCLLPGDWRCARRDRLWGPRLGYQPLGA